MIAAPLNRSMRPFSVMPPESRTPRKHIPAIQPQCL
nr:MAG TPA: hypothetical protein [Caudoviricetes sp.]